MNTSDLLRLYDAQVRGWTGVPAPGFLIENDGPVVRLVGPGPEAHANAVLLANLTDDTVEPAIARQIDFFGGLGHAFEWKHFQHDWPGTLPKRLQVAGFMAHEPETFVALDVAQDLGAIALPNEIRVRHLDVPASFRAIAEIDRAVYGDEKHADWLVETITQEFQADPDAIQIYAAFAGDQPVSVGWMRHKRGDAFGSLWGGMTLPDWRGQRIYSALVLIRAWQARQRGCRWLTVDCRSMSLPILEGQGFQRLSVITPFIWSPAPPETRP
jgi:GNAT superfamily N-acetyltransferase